MKLKKGDSINELTLPSVDGSTFNLETIKGKKAMISFYRYSSCPFCHLRINEIISKKSEFGDNFVPIAIFDCDFDDLVKNSEFVISTTSTGISYPLIYNKTLVIIYSDDYNNDPRLKQ